MASAVASRAPAVEMFSVQAATTSSSSALEPRRHGHAHGGAHGAPARALRLAGRTGGSSRGARPGRHRDQVDVQLPGDAPGRVEHGQAPRHGRQRHAGVGGQDDEAVARALDHGRPRPPGRSGQVDPRPSLREGPGFLMDVHTSLSECRTRDLRRPATSPERGDRVARKSPPRLSGWVAVLQLPAGPTVARVTTSPRPAHPPDGPLRGARRRSLRTRRPVADAGAPARGAGGRRARRRVRLHRQRPVGPGTPSGPSPDSGCCGWAAPSGASSARSSGPSTPSTWPSAWPPCPDGARDP